jgi:signal transduction protein with GAF and PtsI domain
MGVLTVQTATQRAYGERERQIFRTVSGYAAVALANARTLGELAEKHERLAETATGAISSPPPTASSSARGGMGGASGSRSPTSTRSSR